MRFDYDLESAPILKPVDDGIYLLEVVQDKYKKNEETGTDCCTFEFKILQPENVIVDGGRVERLYIPFYISAKDPMMSLGINFRPLFEACEKLESGRKDFDTEEVYGCIFGAEIVKTPGTPEYPDPRNRIRNYFTQANCPPPEIKPPKEDAA